MSTSLPALTRRSASVRFAAHLTFIAALLLGALSCAKKPNLALPHEGAVLSTSPAADLALEQGGALDPAALPLELVELTPRGIVADVRAITLVFNQPMVQAARLQERSASTPVTITPPLEGTWRWEGPRTLTFLPAEALPQATAFAVQVPTTLRSLSGQTLAAEVTQRFTTTPLYIKSSPREYQRFAREEAFFLLFNMPVESAQLQEHLRMVKRSGGAELPAPLELTAAEVDPEGAPIQRGSAFWVRPRGGFERGATYRVTVEAGLKSPVGPLGLTQAWIADLQTYEPLRSTSLICDELCLPDSLWSLHFNNNVDPETIASCLSISPKIRLSVRGYNAQGVVIEPIGARAGTTYTLTSTPRCVDTQGEPLAEPFSETVQVYHLPARVNLEAKITVLKLPASAAEPLKLPVTLRNVKNVRVKMMRITPKNIVEFYDNYRPHEHHLKESIFLKLTPQVNQLAVKKQPLEETHTYEVDLRELLGAPGCGVAYVAVKGERAAEDVEQGEPSAWGIVQVTDIALTAKYSPESSLIWTTRLSTGALLPGVRVSMRTLKGEPLWEGVTDDAGLARGPGTNAFEVGRSYLLMAEIGCEFYYNLIFWSKEGVVYEEGRP